MCVFNRLVPKCGFSRFKIGYCLFDLSKLSCADQVETIPSYSTQKFSEKLFWKRGSGDAQMRPQYASFGTLQSHVRHYGHRLHFWLKVKRAWPKNNFSHRVGSVTFFGETRDTIYYQLVKKSDPPMEF